MTNSFWRGNWAQSYGKKFWGDWTSVCHLTIHEIITVFLFWPVMKQWLVCGFVSAMRDRQIGLRKKWEKNYLLSVTFSKVKGKGATQHRVETFLTALRKFTTSWLAFAWLSLLSLPEVETNVLGQLADCLAHALPSVKLAEPQLLHLEGFKIMILNECETSFTKIQLNLKYPSITQKHYYLHHINIQVLL